MYVYPEVVLKKCSIMQTDCFRLFFKPEVGEASYALGMVWVEAVRHGEGDVCRAVGTGNGATGA